jgi:hypothetical protein
MVANFITPCLAIHNPSLAPGTSVVLVSPPNEQGRDYPPQLHEAKVEERLPAACDDKVGTGDKEVDPSSRSGRAPS